MLPIPIPDTTHFNELFILIVTTGEIMSATKIIGIRVYLGLACMLEFEYLGTITMEYCVTGHKKMPVLTGSRIRDLPHMKRSTQRVTTKASSYSETVQVSYIQYTLLQLYKTSAGCLQYVFG